MPMDPTVSHALFRVASTVGWTFFGVVLLYAGMRLFDMLDPIDHRAELTKGNVAVAIQVGAMILALAAIVVAAIVS